MKETIIIKRSILGIKSNIPQLICYRGQRRTIGGWAEKLGIPYATLLERFENGWSVEGALSTPV